MAKHTERHRGRLQATVEEELSEAFARTSSIARARGDGVAVFGALAGGILLATIIALAFGEEPALHEPTATATTPVPAAVASPSGQPKTGADRGDALDLIEGASNAASAFFYFFGGLAVIAGAILAFRRYVVEQPIDQHWDHSVGPCRVRRYRTSSGELQWAYFLDVDITNRSKARQTPTRFWSRILLPTEPEFADGGSVDLSSVDRVREFFGGDNPDDGTTFDFSDVAPGESFGINASQDGLDLHEIVLLCYCFEVRRRRTIWVGFHGEQRARYPSSQYVGVDGNDLRFYVPQSVERRGTVRRRRRVD